METNSISDQEGGGVERSTTTGEVSELMTLSDVAVYLNLRERTIYDWAQHGRLPAYKLGSNWRFRRSDIDVWLETQRTGPELENGTEIQCSVCSRDLDLSSTAGYCAERDCGRPICRTCWGPRDRRTCQIHTDVTNRPTSVTDLQHMETKGAQSIGPSDETDVNHNLLAARFLDGFSDRVERLPHLATKDGEIVGVTRDWERLQSVTRSGPKEQLSGYKIRGRGRRLPKPGYSSVAYTVKVQAKALATKSKQVRLEARVISFGDRLERTPASGQTRAEVLAAMLESDLASARRSRIHCVLGIYSHLGWTDDAISLMVGEDPSRRFLNPNLSPALIGPGLANMVWNDNDPVMTALTHYFQSTFEDEVVTCKAHISQHLRDSDFYLLSDLEEERSYSHAVTQAAVDSLVNTQQVYLMEERGEVALVRKETK